MSSPTNTCIQLGSMLVGEVRSVAVSFEGKLAASELLNGTPTISVSPASGAPTSSGAAVSTGALVIDGKSVATGRAVTFTLDASAATSGVRYTYTVTATTNGGQTVKAKIRVDVQ